MPLSDDTNATAPPSCSLSYILITIISANQNTCLFKAGSSDEMDTIYIRRGTAKAKKFVEAPVLFEHILIASFICTVPEGAKVQVYHLALQPVLAVNH